MRQNKRIITLRYVSLCPKCTKIQYRKNGESTICVLPRESLKLPMDSMRACRVQGDLEPCVFRSICSCFSFDSKASLNKRKLRHGPAVCVLENYRSPRHVCWNTGMTMNMVRILPSRNFSSGMRSQDTSWHARCEGFTDPGMTARVFCEGRYRTSLLSLRESKLSGRWDESLSYVSEIETRMAYGWT